MMRNGPSGILLFIAFLWAFAADAQPAPPLEPDLVVAATGGGFGGSLQKFFYQPFEAKTGVKVTRVDAELPEQWAKLRAQVDSGSVEFDIVTATPADLIEKRNLLQPIDCAKLANLATEGVAGACDGWGLFRTLPIKSSTTSQGQSLGSLRSINVTSFSASARTRLNDGALM